MGFYSSAMPQKACKRQLVFVSPLTSDQTETNAKIGHTDKRKPHLNYPANISSKNNEHSLVRFEYFTMKIDATEIFI